MQLSELRKRVRLPRGGVAELRGDESLIPDIRGGLRPVDCIERKLGTLLPEETSTAPDTSPRSNSIRREMHVVRKTFK
jgi:hypothetical protein